jgi:ABC-type branched-subunit amino acid transport system substrate-binding protein
VVRVALDKWSVLRVVSAAAVLCGSLLAHAQGVSDREIVLGQSVYLTGALAELGVDFRDGADAFFRQLNERGGVHGRQIKVITLDDAYDPKRALANVDELERKGVFCLWQFAGTGTVREVAPVAAQRRIPLIAAIATGPVLRRQLNPYTFYVRAGNTEEYEAIVNHAIATGIKRLAAVYVQAPYGEEGIKEVEAIVRARGRSLVASVSIKVDGAGSDEAMRQLAAADAQAVILVTVPTSTKAIVRAAKRVGHRATLYALNAGLPVGAMRDLGDDAHGVIVTQVMPNPSGIAVPVVREYQQAMRAAGHTRLSSASIEGFINAKIFAEALRRAGKSPTREALVQAMEGLATYDAGGYRVHFSSARHNGNSYVELSIVSAAGEKFIY